MLAGPMNRSPHVAVVGATGAVGIEMLKTLEKRRFPVGKLTLLASARSAGKTLPFGGTEHTIRELKKDSFAGIDIALFSAGGSISRDFAPIAAQAGCVVIDNSSAFRMDPKVPLVVPEINPADVKDHHGIIANPNCTTAITLMALYPLHRAFGEHPGGVEPLAEADDLRLFAHRDELAVPQLGDEQQRGVRPQIDRAQPHRPMPT